jgi:25S rRNA (uracil2634-N3)-methyltransferase
MFAFASTYECAVQQFCIPCFYKLFPTGKTSSDVKLPPNVRPELCPRSSGGDQAAPLYSSKARMLTVGDGDLSFSRSLAQLGYAEKLTATTHESLQSIRSTYPNADEILGSLRDSGVTLFHEVDATNFEGHSALRERSFDVVIWNFPCIRVERGADGQVSELEMNKQLLRTFFRSVKGILAVGGEVHVAHKTIEPFSWWGLCDIALEEDFQLFREIAFDRCNFPGYTNRKVLDRKSFPCHDARVSVPPSMWLRISLTLVCPFTVVHLHARCTGEAQESPVEKG